MGELASVRSLFPVVAEKPCAGELGTVGLRLARSVGAHERNVLTRTKRAGGEHHLVPGRDRDQQIGGERHLERRGNLGAELGGDLARALLVDVPDRYLPAAREERARRRTAVHTGADHRSRRRVVATQRLGREHRGRAGSERCHGRCVEDRPQLSVLGVRQEHDTRHRRQSALRVAGERGDPLEQRMSRAERRHRAEVPGRVVRDVDLRRHRPLAARVCDERLAHRFDRALRRDRLLDAAAVEDRYHRHRALTAAVSLATDSFASPNSIIVFGSRKSGLSIPANPGFIERLSTITAFDSSTLRIGMP